MMKAALRFLFRCARKLRLQSWCYRSFLPFYHDFLPATAEQAEAACRRLSRIHPDEGQSCLCRNRQETPFAYDLQVVIPAYNAEDYIEECMESVLGRQTGYKVLVVVVNDGSTDGTLAILNKYVGRPDVCLISQENRGFSGARNRGLEQIRARYIMFLDADDRLADGAVEALMREADRTDADIVEGGYSRFCGQKILSTFRHRDMQTEDWRVLYGFPVGKVYKSWLFGQVCFPPGYWFEDTICIYVLYPRSRRVATIHDVVYLYRMNEQGITFTSRGRAKTLDAFYVTRRVLDDSRRLGIPLTPMLYDNLLVDLRVNYTRFVSLDDNIHRDAFLACAAMLQNYFPGFRTLNSQLRPLEQSLLRRDYGAYRLYGQCYIGV